MKENYAVGDTVWFANGGESLVKGEIVAVLDLDRYAEKQYVIEVQTHIDPVLYVRDWATLSTNEKGPLNIWKWLKRCRG